MALETPRGLTSVPIAKTPGGLTSVRPAKTPGGLTIVPYPEAGILAIEGTRRRLGLSTTEMLRRAGVDWKSWRMLRTGKARPRKGTLRRLHGALTGVERINPASGLIRAVMVLLAREFGDDPEALLAQDFSAERPFNPLWLRAATVRRYAMTIVAIDLDAGNAAVGRACGCSRQAVKQARDVTERAREQNHGLDDALTRVTTLVSGRALDADPA